MIATVTCTCGRPIAQTRAGMWAHTSNPGAAHHYARPVPPECPAIIPSGILGAEWCRSCGRGVYRVRFVGTIPALRYRHKRV